MAADPKCTGCDHPQHPPGDCPKTIQIGTRQQAGHRALPVCLPTTTQSGELIMERITTHTKKIAVSRAVVFELKKPRHALKLARRMMPPNTQVLEARIVAVTADEFHIVIRYAAIKQEPRLNIEVRDPQPGTAAGYFAEQVRPYAPLAKKVGES